ncbi:DNA polymerase III subunit tau [compost metagenome]
MADKYLPYHRKHRPINVTQYVGNEKTKKGVMAALRGKNIPQVIMFQGVAGCGKTSFARLVAKEIRCENRDPITGACGVCYSCKEFEEYIETGETGVLSNVTEIDAAESNKRKDVDLILEEANLPSFDGSWKIYILDECHAMTPSAQTRLLKNLEEPAEKVLMILCTTDPEQLLPTIISRCQNVFNITKPSRDELGGLLARVCRKENVEFDTRALSVVCTRSDFVPRKALILLEQVVREKQAVLYENTLEVLNVTADKYFFEFFSLLLAERINIYKYIEFIGNLKKDMDLTQFVSSLLEFTIRGIYISNNAKVEALDKSEIQQYTKLFSKFNGVDVAYMLTVLLEMKTSKDVEAKLLLMGYTGLTQKVLLNDGIVKLDSNKDSDVAKEKKAGNENYLQSITMTEEEKQEIIEDNTKLMDLDDIAKMFGGEIFKPN